jgi:hypothetical protein
VDLDSQDLYVLGLLDPDPEPFVQGTDLDPRPEADPSIPVIMQNS